MQSNKLASNQDNRHFTKVTKRDGSMKNKKSPKRKEPIMCECTSPPNNSSIPRRLPKLIRVLMPYRGGVLTSAVRTYYVHIVYDVHDVNNKQDICT